jgi:hypothetical protein
MRERVVSVGVFPCQLQDPHHEQQIGDELQRRCHRSTCRCRRTWRQIRESARVHYGGEHTRFVTYRIELARGRPSRRVGSRPLIMLVQAVSWTEHGGPMPARMIEVVQRERWRDVRGERVGLGTCFAFDMAARRQRFARSDFRPLVTVYRNRPGVSFQRAAG